MFCGRVTMLEPACGAAAGLGPGLWEPCPGGLLLPGGVRVPVGFVAPVTQPRVVLCPSPPVPISSLVGEGTELCVNSRSPAHQWSQRGALEVNVLWGPSVLLCECFLEADACH